MTSRERFLSVLNFQKPDDHLPMVEWAAWWDQTIRRWEGEGFPKDLPLEESLRYFDLDPLFSIGAAAWGPGCPQPDRHGAGILTDEASYEQIRPHLFPEDSVKNLAAQAADLKARHERGEFIVRLSLEGFFWFPRGLLGIENHMFAFFDRPELVHRINRDLAEFNLRVIDALCPVLLPDMAGIAEDMSYNNGPMLSRECFNKFLLPYYHQVVPALKARGIKVLVDTDGQVEPMIPWLMEAGVEGVYPLEHQSGVDVARIRRDYPRFLMMGGYDKMVMPRGGAAMRAEFERLLPVMVTGGYVPSVDHQTPPGVSFENYCAYVRLFREFAHRAVKG